MTEPSAAEFWRFVQEAREQRARADALSMALAQLKEKLALYWVTPPTGRLQPNWHCTSCGGEHESPSVKHRDYCILAADQPAAAGAELLAAADRLADALDQADQWLGVGPIIKSDRAEFDRDEREFKAALTAYRRARAGHRAAGPEREGE
jgi:hypothetical protein